MILKRNAPAKLNLGLHVLRRRPDGYHDLETVFVRLPWADIVSGKRAEALSLLCTDPTLTTDESNLVMKAARHLAAACRIEEGAALHLAKHLPYGAGLGGGSSDAAATLRLLVELWGLDVGEEALADIALSLGSDVPFFLGPEAAYATGRGEQLTPLVDPETDAPYQPPFAFVVAVPPEHVSTAEAYRGVTPRAEGRPDLRAVVLSNDLERWRRELVNDFESSVFARYPVIRSVKEALEDAGAGYAAMSGSGSAVFGVFEDDEDAASAAEAMRFNGHRTWEGRLR